MEYDDTNKGVAFSNDKKTDKQPDFRGKGNFNGQDFEFGMWERTSKSGKSYYSFSFGEPYQKTETKSGSWEQAREKFAKKDEVITDINDEEEIDISAIPF